MLKNSKVPEVIMTILLVLAVPALVAGTVFKIEPFRSESLALVLGILFLSLGFKSRRLERENSILREKLTQQSGDAK